MPLRAVVYQADSLNHGRKDCHTLPSSFGGSFDDDDDGCSYVNLSSWPLLSMSENEFNNVTTRASYIQQKGSKKGCPRNRRRRCGGGGMHEEVMQLQRLTHIAAERNRRKQVNEHLSTLRSLMPHSYANKGDQASIVGGAINFVKELEQKLQWLESHKCCKNYTSSDNPSPSSLHFSDFITSSHDLAMSDSCSLLEKMMNNNNAADVEVSVADCFANMKIRATTGVVKNWLLMRILEHLDECKLTVLHLNICSVDQVIIYTICMKVEDECNLTTGDEIAADIHQLLSTMADQTTYA